MLKRQVRGCGHQSERDRPSFLPNDVSESNAKVLTYDAIHADRVVGHRVVG